MLKDRLPKFISENYDCMEWRHASAIMTRDFKAEWRDLTRALIAFRLHHRWIDGGGGNKSEISHSFDRLLQPVGWREVDFQNSIQLKLTSKPWNPLKLKGKKKPRSHSENLREEEIPTHSIDCFKNRIALELEWNNKDPFYDRDLNNFRLLFNQGAISVGIIITRSDSLQRIFNDIGRGSSYGMSTTHLSKLIPRIEGGGAAGCPLLVFGITDRLYVP